MNLKQLLGNGTAAPPYVAALAYAGLILGLMAVIVTSWDGIRSRTATLDGLNDILARLEGATPGAPRATREGAAVAGSYFLEGPTVTVAGAALLQRVIAIVTQHGGNVVSSQVDMQGTQSKDGFLTVIASCILEQAALQKTLYDIEAGMPFLFVEQLDAQAATNSTGAAGGKLRVLLSISGQWQGAR